MKSPSLSLLTSDLVELISRGLVDRGFAQEEPQSLYAPIDYVLSLGGKRVRPQLALFSAYLLSDSWEVALPVALAVEIFHNFTLLHDDLMDSSPMRRGKPSVHTRWGANTAILSGDAMSIEAYRALEDLPVQVLGRVFPIFNKMAIDICRGQQYDMLFEQESQVSVAEYMEMIRLKTSVLLGASMQMGALAVGAAPELADKLYLVGEKMGLAFQIQDDLLDTYGDELTLGKPIGMDILNAKKTLLLLYTQEYLGSQDRAQLDALLSLPQEQASERIDGVKTLYELAGARSHAERLIACYTEQALELLSEVEHGSGRGEALRDLIQTLAHRDR